MPRYGYNRSAVSRLELHSVAVTSRVCGSVAGYGISVKQLDTSHVSLRRYSHSMNRVKVLRRVAVLAVGKIDEALA